MSEIKLKPCPFCGGKAKLPCGNLDCGILAQTADRPTPQEAAKLWNARCEKGE